MYQSLSQYGRSTTRKSFKSRQYVGPNRQSPQVVRPAAPAPGPRPTDDRVWESMDPWGLLKDELLAADSDTQTHDPVLDCPLPSVWSVYDASHHD